MGATLDPAPSPAPSRVPSRVPSRLLALALSLALSLALALVTTFPAIAQEIVDVELALAADGSGSIDDDEFRVQREGYAQAITSPEVLRAITSGPNGAIALTYIEWGAPESQHTIVDWMVIDGPEAAARFAAALVAAPRIAWGYNSISAAIAYAARAIRENDIQGLARIIDVSGDGPQMNGPPLPAVRAATLDEGITINGLVIERGRTRSGPYGEPLEEHYRRDVIGGLAPFVIVADERTSFAAAIRRKLVLEIATANEVNRRAAAPMPNPSVQLADRRQ